MLGALLSVFRKPVLVASAEPLHPDLRRPDKKGMFGIIVKDSPAQVGIQNLTTFASKNAAHS